ncbi:Isoprenylcysteine carboxyl methyltransferase (ICMT) family protein [Mycobacteroides salmoniphilum]|uniref:Isoprenylcysteine carboxyl methyltransferase (ICMT) family protein n=1 Tax=Mycobacteroides salmoniphilum TaxID=404941 RepID=A0A4R8RY30_9MYCO|nr:isoprenylcysteine carboxylmethyltransferase family protein [Mycobacteroides salmoniphilum]TDZ79199.1 Isoprenylcysteine carboxyl methyltransferase (ICMT) family protein [Mycobacteroides salmoniphilum]TDZ81272.1 Isoprenylcysteine carboxyl methyltransferase (ICMT) family protein [Mycobacteroides salmoniphilum]TDZ88772.1 Isoprenylcysteine carboxyl methyltransferase (ICMT) family protein [Mycobacteroides salmoniphilum]
MKTGVQALVSGIIGLAVFAAALFWPAGTFDYWQAWVFLAIFVISSAASSIYLATTNPEVLQRRLHGGPIAETRLVQKVAVTVLLSSFVALVVVSAFDHRFGWSHVPTWLVMVGEVLVITGLSAATLVVAQNNYAGASITVESGQTVTSTGLYGLVRHPMYTGSLVMMVGMPLALGSYWGLLAAVPATASLVVRILDEEKMLRHDLQGYDEYTEKVRNRLVPLVW